MLRTLLVLLATLLFGAALGQGALDLPVTNGLLGALAMLAAAFYLRARWQRDPQAPEAPERRALLSLGGTAVVLGHMLATLWEAGPALDLHTPASHAMGVDSWTLFGAALLTLWVARAPGPVADERDRQIAASAQRCAFIALSVQVLAVAVWLSFGKSRLLEEMSRAMFAHVLIAAWIVSCMVQDLSCLLAYAREHRLNAAA